MKKALSAGDLPPGRSAEVTIDGRSVALFNVGGEFFALENRCPHRGGPLGQGFLDGKTVFCPWHDWQVDVASGECLNVPGARVRRFPVRVEGSDVLVDVEVPGTA